MRWRRGHLFTTAQSPLRCHRFRYKFKVFVMFDSYYRIPSLSLSLFLSHLLLHFSSFLFISFRFLFTLHPSQLPPSIFAGNLFFLALRGRCIFLLLLCIGFSAPPALLNAWFFSSSRRGLLLSFCNHTLSFSFSRVFFFPLRNCIQLL